MKAPVFSAPAGSSPTRQRIQDVVRAQANANPRHRQLAIGPSELGEECDRRLTYRLLDMPGANHNSDPWASIVGTAVHHWLAEAFTAANHRIGWSRYLVEQRVWMTDGLSGTADLYDVLEAEVIDHKVLGPTSMGHIKNGVIPGKYRTQIQLYGYGFAQLGFPVRTVTLACYPRSGFLDGLQIWSVPYDPAVAIEALDRQAKLVTAAVVLDLEAPTNPLWTMIPANSGPDCARCPYWRPGRPVDGDGCPGLTV